MIEERRVGSIIEERRVGSMSQERRVGSMLEERRVGSIREERRVGPVWAPTSPQVNRFIENVQIKAVNMISRLRSVVQ